LARQEEPQGVAIEESFGNEGQLPPFIEEGGGLSCRSDKKTLAHQIRRFENEILETGWRGGRDHLRTIVGWRGTSERCTNNQYGKKSRVKQR